MDSQHNDRRELYRYDVTWNAMLEGTFPDVEDRLPVKVVNYSDAGALVLAGKLRIGKHWLSGKPTDPELKLHIYSPEGAFQQRVRIRWTKWLEDRQLFEIGVEFVDLTSERELLIDKLIQDFNRQPGLSGSSDQALLESWLKAYYLKT